jgi:hypothetical protein
MTYSIDQFYFDSPTTIFADFQSAGGQYVRLIVQRLRDAGHSDDNIQGRVIAFSENQMNIIHLKNRNKDLPLVYKLYREIEDIDMKFDVELFNPPYQQGMFVQFMNKGFELLKEGGVMCAIHPSTYIINKKETTKGKEHVILNNTIEKYKSSVNLVDGNAIFENAGFLTPLSITTIIKEEDKNINVYYNHLGESKSSNVTSVSEIWMHGNDLAQSIFNRIKSKMKTSVEDHLSKKGKRSKYYLNINKVSGNRSKPGAIGNNPDFNCLLYKTDVDSGKYTDKLSTDFKEGDFNYIGIDSKKQAKNLYNYLTTKFARFTVSLYKINVQLSRGELKIVPFLDFNESWDDKKCFDYFGLTQEEREFVNTYIQDYYGCEVK